PLTIKNSTITATSNPWNNTLFEVKANGQTNIGQRRQDGNTGNHNTALLQVNGDVAIGALGSANIWVTQTNWADFVFDPDYKLMPLNEVERFYKEKHHLPNVPTTESIQTNGNNL